MRRLALALGLVLLSGGARAEGSSVEFTLLSYNVRGLPSWAAGDAPERRSPAISKRARRYDVILFQEDFQHHDTLVGALEHPMRERGNGSRLLLSRVIPWIGGSGLTTLARGASIRGEVSREPLPGCSGWVGSGMDCWATKGLLRVGLALGSGLELEVYNTHLDAGREASDRSARAEQLEALAARIEALSPKGALIVAGDLNLRETSPEDRALLDRFRGRLRLRDSEARGRAAVWPHRIDYILYRDGPRETLRVLGAGEAREFSDTDPPLSDHPALYAHFELRARAPRP